MDKNTNINKRIFKNTTFLYMRMLFTMAVSLYTSRIVLDVLGVDDFAIYGVIGGVVIVISSISNTMSTALQRFLNFECGKGNIEALNKIFNIGLIVMMAFSLIIVLVCETGGIWLIDNILKIPPSRLSAAKWVFQFTIISIILSVIRIPFIASVISEERMSFYAICSMIESVLKLIIVIILSKVISVDKLIFYSFLMMLISLVITLLYYVFCQIKISFCRIKLLWDRILFRQIFNFAGWNFLGILSELSVPQVITMFINVFVSLVVNTAYLIANQVNQAIYNFVISFQMAFRPQITKLYAANSESELKVLLVRSAKFSFILLLYLAIPFVICADFVIDKWLVDVPEYTVPFCRLMVIASLFDAISAPIWMLVHATGSIKKYQIGTFIISFMLIPLSFFVVVFHISPLYIIWSKVLISIFIMLYRIYYIKKAINVGAGYFCKNVIFKSFAVFIFSLVLPLVVNGLTLGWTNLLIVTISSIVSITLFTLLIGLTKKEKKSIQQMAFAFLKS